MLYPKRKILLVFLLVVMLTTFSSAQGCASTGFMGTFQQNSNVTITETCPTCTFINVTLKAPNSNILLENQPMVLANGIFVLNVSSGNNTIIGTYFIEGHSNLDDPFIACYDITNIIRQVSTSESILYFLLLLSAILFFVFAVWGTIALPFSNNRDEFARITAITWLKYVKVAMFFISYLLLVWIFNLLHTISNNAISLTQYNGFFEMIFNILVPIAYVVFSIMFIMINVMMFRDLKLNKLLQRGITPQ